jgi:hypothetical protein
MEMFLISFVIFLLMALAISIGILIRGRSMHAGCRVLPEGSNCKYKSLCGDNCRRVQ